MAGMARKTIITLKHLGWAGITKEYKYLRKVMPTAPARELLQLAKTCRGYYR